MTATAGRADEGGRHLAGRDPDAVIRAIASRQRGVVARWQLLDAGVREHVIDYRVERARLRSIHRGVYQVGPVKTRYHREMAAVLACGPCAALSHGSAATVWGLLKSGTPDPRVHVSGPRSRRGPARGVHLHRVELDPADVARRHGLPITTPPRTLLDLASGVRPVLLERVLRRAQRRALVTPDALDDVVARHAGRPGVAALRNLVRRLDPPLPVRSEAEARFLELVRRSDLPRPLSNVVVEGLEVDFLWRDERLAVEIDGFAYHSGRHAFERDRRRDLILAAAGFRVIRITWRQLTHEHHAMLLRLARALKSAV